MEDDRSQINNVIQQLDEKKRLALEETWKQVGMVLGFGSGYAVEWRIAVSHSDEPCYLSKVL